LICKKEAHGSIRTLIVDFLGAKFLFENNDKQLELYTFMIIHHHSRNRSLLIQKSFFRTAFGRTATDKPWHPSSVPNLYENSG